MTRTKIIATIGPACDSKEKIKQLIEAGMNVARINFSHGDHDSNGKAIKYIKELREKMNMPIGIMADLQGPRIRVVVDKDLEIKKGEVVLISDIFSEKVDSKKYKIIKLDYDGIIKDIKKDEEILFEDGLIKTRVTEKNKNYILAEVIEEGIVKNHKGVNIPDTKLKTGVITKKDEADLKFALKQDVDFVALSFVSNAKEIIGVKEKIKKLAGKSKRLPQVIAKIERREAIKNIMEIIRSADGIMVARGDLGVEMDESRVVIYQKEIIARCLRNATPVIVATQMLNSMIENFRPTRAEVSDVSNAVIDHADAVMLSGETSSGKYPIESVKVMSDIISQTEKSPFDILAHGFLGDKKTSVSSAIAHLAHELLKDTNAKMIAAASVSGFTARMIARHRPEKTIFVMTNNEKTYYQLSLVWGVKSFILPDCKTLEELIDKSIKTLKKEKVAQTKDKIIIVAGRPRIAKEHMSLVKVEEVA